MKVQTGCDSVSARVLQPQSVGGGSQYGWEFRRWLAQALVQAVRSLFFFMLCCLVWWLFWARQHPDSLENNKLILFLTEMSLEAQVYLTSGLSSCSITIPRACGGQDSGRHGGCRAVLPWGSGEETSAWASTHIALCLHPSTPPSPWHTQHTHTPAEVMPYPVSFLGMIVVSFLKMLEYIHFFFQIQSFYIQDSFEYLWFG